MSSLFEKVKAKIDNLVFKGHKVEPIMESSSEWNREMLVGYAIDKIESKIRKPLFCTVINNIEVNSFLSEKERKEIFFMLDKIHTKQVEEGKVAIRKEVEEYLQIGWTVTREQVPYVQIQNVSPEITDKLREGKEKKQRSLLNWFKR